MKKLLTFVLVTVMLFTIIPTKVFAEEKTIIASEKNTEEIEILGEKFLISSNISENFVVFESISKTGEKNRFIYDKETGISLLNGKKINLKFDQYIEQSSINNIIVARVNDPYTPIYVTTQKISFNESINSVGAIATIIGGVIAVASLTGLALPSIASVIGDWASVVGLGSLAAGHYCSGSFSYKLYRTKDPVQFGEASWPQTAYRYQDSSVTFSVKQKTMYHSYNKIGSWWYGSKPF